MQMETEVPPNNADRMETEVPQTMQIDWKQKCRQTMQMETEVPPNNADGMEISADTDQNFDQNNTPTI